MPARVHVARTTSLGGINCAWVVLISQHKEVRSIDAITKTSSYIIAPNPPPME